MLTFYHHFRSYHSRQVWSALIEKKITCELILERFSAVPAIEENGLKIEGSFPILDYLEAKYPQPALMPCHAEALAKIRQVVKIVNELEPAIAPMLGGEYFPEKACQRVCTALTQLEHLLGEQYFVDHCFTRAEIVAGAIIPSLPHLGISLNGYPRLQAWSERLTKRPSWAGTRFGEATEMLSFCKTNRQAKVTTKQPSLSI